jgi:hypothetical protein
LIGIAIAIETVRVDVTVVASVADFDLTCITNTVYLAAEYNHPGGCGGSRRVTGERQEDDAHAGGVCGIWWRAGARRRRGEEGGGEGKCHEDAGEGQRQIDR